MVKVAVVGVGYWGPNFVRIMDELQEAELKVVCDSDSAKFEKISGLYPHLEFTDDLESVVSDQSIDAAVVATGSDSHFEIARKFLAENKHVLVEKPLALRSVDAEEIVNMAADRSRVLLVGHLLRYHKGVQKLKEYIDESRSSRSTSMRGTWAGYSTSTRRV
jgi:predicted dehydrogenase